MGAQGEAQLRVVLAGELVQFAGAGHLMQHVGQVGRATQRVGKALGLHGEVGVFDLVQCTSAIGQLHTSAQFVVAAAGGGRLPLARGLALAFDQKALAAYAARGRQRGQHGVARHQPAIQRDGGDHVDQRIQVRGSIWQGQHAQRGGADEIGRRSARGGKVGARRHGGAQLAIQHGLGAVFGQRHAVDRRLGALALLGPWRLRVGLRLARLIAARVPGVVGDHTPQNQPAGHRQTHLQRTHFVVTPLADKVSVHRPCLAPGPSPPPRIKVQPYPAYPEASGRGAGHVSKRRSRACAGKWRCRPARWASARRERVKGAVGDSGQLLMTPPCPRPIPYRPPRCATRPAPAW